MVGGVDVVEEAVVVEGAVSDVEVAGPVVGGAEVEPGTVGCVSGPTVQPASTTRSAESVPHMRRDDPEITQAPPCWLPDCLASAYR